MKHTLNLLNLFVTMVFFVSLTGGAKAALLVSSVSPDSGFANSSITISGTGLGSLTSALFHSFPSGNEVSSSVNILNDTVATTTVPTGLPFTNSPNWVLALFTATESSVFFKDLESVIRISTNSTGSGSTSFIVNSGGLLNGGIGSSVIYIEAGGTFENIGGGSNLIFVKAGGSYIGNGGGGGNNIFYETGATLSEGLTGTQLNNITIASIPEPSSAILIGLTSLVFAAQRRRIQFKE